MKIIIKKIVFFCLVLNVIMPAQQLLQKENMLLKKEIKKSNIVCDQEPKLRKGKTANVRHGRKSGSQGLTLTFYSVQAECAEAFLGVTFENTALASLLSETRTLLTPLHLGYPCNHAEASCLHYGLSSFLWIQLASPST